MMKEAIKFVIFSGLKAGPTIEMDYKNKVFSITLFDDWQWLVDQRKVTDSMYATIGEANRAQLHEQLDKFIRELYAAR